MRDSAYNDYKVLYLAGNVTPDHMETLITMQLSTLASSDSQTSGSCKYIVDLSLY